MKLRSLIVATFVLLALVGALYWSDHRKPKDEALVRPADAPSILKLDEGAITRVEIKKTGAEPVVLSKDSGSWKMLEPKPLAADQGAVSGLLSTLSSLNSERLVEDKANDLKQFGLDQPALQVSLTEKDNKSQRLLMGDDTPAGGAVYAMLAGDPRVYTIASYTKTSVDKGPNDLRDKRLLTVSPDKISRLEVVRQGQTVEFGRSKDAWQILQPKPLRADSAQVSELVRKLTEARMDVNADPKDAESAFAHGMPVATAKVTDPSGVQELQIHKSNDAYYAKSSLIEGTFKVDSGLGQAIDKGLEDFRNKKLFDFGYSEPDKIEMRSGAKSYLLSRSGSDWWSNGKKEDAVSVQMFVSKLRDFAASKFVESGFVNPTIELVVTSDDGKRTEKVSIAKSSSVYIAKRENEPTVYELTPDSVDELQKAADDIKPAAASGK